MIAHDRIFIRDLKVETQIGIYAWEQKIKQPVILNFEFAVDIRKAAASNAVADTIDYHQLILRVQEFITRNHFPLLEALAEQVADLVLHEFKVVGLKLTASKPNVLSCVKEVGIVIERGNKL